MRKSTMKNWLITGVSRGLGKALAEACAGPRRYRHRNCTRYGASGRDRQGLSSTVCGSKFRDPAAIGATVAEAFELAGRLDVVVNNAGYGLLGAIENANDAEMAHLFDVMFSVLCA